MLDASEYLKQHPEHESLFKDLTHLNLDELSNLNKDLNTIQRVNQRVLDGVNRPNG